MKDSEAISTDGSLNLSDQKQDSLAKTPRKPRRKWTEAEKAASRERSARDKFSLSQWDPKEPPLHGISAGAILFAISLVKRAWRHGRDFKPGRVVAEVAEICELAEDESKRLRRWVAWIKPRKWVLQEDKRSAVVSWSHTGPGKELIWTAELEAEWRQRIVAGAQAKAAKASSANVASSQDRHSEPRSLSAGSSSQARTDSLPPAPVAAGASHVEASDRLSGQEVKSFGSGVESGTRTSQETDPKLVMVPKASPFKEAGQWDARTSPFVFPSLPFGAFKSGARDANAFFNAIQAQDEDKLAESVRDLAFKPNVVREICSRSTSCKECIEKAFKHFGASLP